MTVSIDGTNGITTPAESVTGTGVWSVGSSQIYKDASGNVGIGTSSPSQKLQVAATTNQLSLTTGTNELIARANSTEVALYTFQAIPLNFYTNNTERARFDINGNLLINTTSGLNGGFFVVNSGASQNIIESNSTRTSTITYHLLCNNGNGLVGSITSINSTTTYATSSDYRLKENVQPMQNALATVAALKPVTYNWKADGSAGQGFIAHELQAVVPDAVVGEKDAIDKDGKPQYQGVDTSFLVATLTKAIQELNTKVDVQAAEIAVLKGN